MELKNLFTKEAQNTYSAVTGGIKKKIKPVIDMGSELVRQNVEAIQPAVSSIKDTVNTFSDPIIKPIQKERQKIQAIGEINTFFNDAGITLDDIKALAEDEGLDSNEVITKFKRNGIKVQGMEELQAQEDAKLAEEAKQGEDWYSQKSYFADQRPDEGIKEQTGKGIIRTPLTFAQNAISGPENIAQGSLNLLDKTLGEGALNPILNAIGQGIKGDKYKPLPTWYNDVPSTNQYTENVASNIIGAGKEALTTGKTYSQANEELKQQQYKAGKDQGIGGALANIGGGTVSSAFNIMAPGASALYAGASEMPGTQYVTQGLGAITQAPIDYIVNKSGGTQDTAEQIGTMANLALPLGRNKIASMKPTSNPGKILQKTAVTTADAIINPLGTIKDVGVKVFSKNPRSVEDIVGNILQPYKGMTENLDDATNGMRRVVEETGTKTSTYDGLLTAIKNIQNKYGKMLSDSLGQITTSTKSQLFDTALTQLAKIYEGVSSSDMRATLARINELGKKNATTGLTPAEKNEVKILHTKANNLFTEKGKETGGFSSDDLRGMRRDMVSEINKEASDAGITNIADINKAYGELSDARTLAENQVANLKAYKGRTPPPTTMAKITNMIVDFPIIKQVFSDPTRAVASALFKNLRGDKINPIEVQGRLSGFLKELKKAGAKAEELKKIEQIMLSMKLLPETSSAKIPLTPTEQDEATIKQSNQGISPKLKTNGNLDNSIPIAPNNRTESVKGVKLPTTIIKKNANTTLNSDIPTMVGANAVKKVEGQTVKKPVKLTPKEKNDIKLAEKGPMSVPLEVSNPELARKLKNTPEKQIITPKKPTPNTIKNESKVKPTVSSDTIPKGIPKVIGLTNETANAYKGNTGGGIKNVEPGKQVKYNQGDSYEPVRMALTQKDADIARFGALSKKQMKTSVTENEKLEMAGIKGRLKMSNAQLETRAQELRDIAKLARSNKESVLVDLRNGELPEGYFKNAFGEIQKNPSNKKGGFIKIPNIGKKGIPVKNPLVKPNTIKNESKVTPSQTQANGPRILGKMGKVETKTSPQSATSYEAGMRRPFTMQSNNPIVKRVQEKPSNSKGGFIKIPEIVKKSEAMQNKVYHVTDTVNVKPIEAEGFKIKNPSGIGFRKVDGIYFVKEAGGVDYVKNQAKLGGKNDLGVVEATISDSARIKKFNSVDDFDDFLLSNKEYMGVRIEDKAKAQKVATKLLMEAGYDVVEIPYGKTTEVIVLNPKMVKVNKSIPVNNPLVEEARKYKSAEEFIKAKENSGDIVYHGTKTNFDSFSKEKLGLNTGASSAKEGFFFTDSKQNANHYTKTDINADAIIGKIAKNDNLLLSTNYGVKRFGYTNPIDALYSGGKKELTKSEILKKVSEDFDIEINKSIGEVSMYPKFLQKGILDKLDSIKNSKKELLDLWEKGLEDNTKVGANIKKVLLKYKKPFVTTENHVNKSGGQFTKLTGDNGEKFTSYTDAIKYAKENGYDAVRINGANDPLPGNTVVVFNENQILTESQLRKIYEESKK